MALTADQEAVLLQIITAFQGGKRLSDLPQIGNTNPFDLIIEVLDKDGETKQSKLAALLPYVEDQCAYGIEYNTALPSPLCTRIGSVALHQKLPVQNRMRGCLLNNNGKVVEYLHPTNWKAHVLDGSNGQVMIEIPMHYRKFETEGTIQRCKISEHPLPGYHIVPLMYISAYEASMERSTGKLCSVVNMGADYRGGADQADWDGSHRTLLGRPTTVKSRTQFRAAARLRNASATSEWNCQDYNAYKAMFWLYYVEYANRNCQSPFNAQKDANGYAQGGLGNGVTTISSTQWSEYNGYYPFIPCGHTDDLGNGSGEVAYPIPLVGSVLATVSTPRYRGIENPFGHIWKWTDGINTEVLSDADGGTSKVYVADNPADYNDVNYVNHTLRGLESRDSSQYVREIIFGELGDIIASLCGGGSTTYWADYHYTDITSSSLRGILFGGIALNGAYAGFGYSYSIYAPSYTDAYVGSRLCFIPES